MMYITVLGVDNMTQKRDRQKRAEALLADVVQAVQEDIERPVQAIAARTVLAQVLDWGEYAALSEETIEELRTWPATDFQKWRQEFHWFLLCNVNRTVDQAVPLVPIRGEILFSPVPGRDGRTQLFGPLRDLLWFQLLFLTRTSGFDRLLRCDCGKMFVKVGRREFCSERCQKRVYKRNERAEAKRGTRGGHRGQKTRTR
jgi:hypothetical protein